ncbi:phosphoethanolamine transferase [Pectinatus haikarae]|uniref:Heptose-I-phosphate ethanolaminephosphotransferase n=1 Tax=Pectinatus haikarae TaxID=349096 RepID=A0ABT9Y557_9FIRM|nr:phosphoethanolamine transferase [Pectinatus haikarae]MDQ0202968.1 heptose-I-phosphate ethanolaminephosphotransferase [Pectinatus haikarae]
MRLMTKNYRAGSVGFLVASLVFYICLVLFYINIGQDMGPVNYFAYLLPTIISLCLIQYLTGSSLFSAELSAHILPGLAWCITFPLLYSWTYHSAWYISQIRIDFLFGTGLFIMLASLQAVFLQSRMGKSKAAVLFAVLDILCLLIPALEIAYYLIYQHCLTPATLMALYLTNPKESVDFVQSTVGVFGIVLVLISIGMIFYFMYRMNRRLSLKLITSDPDRKKKSVLYLLTLFTAVYSFFFLFPQTSIINNWKEVSDYVQQTQKYSINYTERYEDMQLSSAATLAQKAPGTVIMVIGESASRNYMKTYTPSFAYDDTPWLEQRRQDPNFVVFDNAYSSWVQTVPVLQRALTEQSQYNDKQFYNSLSVIDVAKKAGYDTYWFSNQGRYGQYDSAITLIAKTADHAKWTDDSYVFTDQVDGTLLNFLPEIDPSKNNFVVLHLMGSHIYYNNRYPADFEKWKNEDSTSTESSYANSILYTDYILSQIYNYAKENLHLQAMVYYSDHGEDVNISHNPDVFKFDMVRIPMFVYLSGEYQRTYPVRSSTLQQNQGQYFTNDMIYDTVCGILNAPSNHYDEGQDFSSPQYKFNLQNLTTMLGQRKLTEDPYIGKPQ